MEQEKKVAKRIVQLEETVRELEAFSYSVAHDLKAPLRGIDGFSRLLAQKYLPRLDAEGCTLLRSIQEGVSHMHNLIEGLLAYSRMERRNLQKAILDLPSLVRKVAEACQPQLGKNGGALFLDIPEIHAHADKEGLEMVLRNLLENGIKFSRGAQPPTIEVGARGENHRVILWVRDNGIGFDMRFHDRIFEMFGRLHGSEDFSGTGVGLALVRKAMQRMGGRVWAESTPGQGAAFYLDLPRGESFPGHHADDNSLSREL